MRIALGFLIIALPNAVAAAFIASWQAGVLTLALMIIAISSLVIGVNRTSLLRRVARRCEVHHRPSYPRIRDLERELGYPETSPISDVDAVGLHLDPDLTDCGHPWCLAQRPESAYCTFTNAEQQRFDSLAAQYDATSDAGKRAAIRAELKRLAESADAGAWAAM